MFITLKKHYQIIEKYEKRIDDLLNRLMSRNFSEYEIAKKVKIPSTDEELESVARTDDIEYEIEQKRINDVKSLQEKAERLKAEMFK